MNSTPQRATTTTRTTATRMPDPFARRVYFSDGWKHAPHGVALERKNVVVCFLSGKFVLRGETVLKIFFCFVPLSFQKGRPKMYAYESPKKKKQPRTILIVFASSLVRRVDSFFLKSRGRRRPIFVARANASASASRGALLRVLRFTPKLYAHLHVERAEKIYEADGEKRDACMPRKQG